MKKLTTIALFLTLSTVAYAQDARVGINTTTPKTTLDVSGKTDTFGNLLTTDVTGMQAPRLTRAELTAKGNVLYGTDQKGALIYITDITGGDANATSPRIKITTIGYYYFDGTIWQRVISSGAGDSNFWSLVGNDGTTAGTNFLGTTDDQDLVFKRNGVQSGWLNKAKSNTAFGVGSLAITATGSGNTAIGLNALAANTTADYNTALGVSTLINNTTGSFNTAVGTQALSSNTTGSSNLAVGVNALSSNITGANNVAVGNSALNTNTTGDRNTATGFEALYSNTTGNTNVANGYGALYRNTTGSNNTAIGNEALSNNTIGAANTAIGLNALQSNTIGNQNVAIGNLALPANLSGTFNTSLGSRSMLVSTTGSNNTGAGYQALSSNTSGNSNTGLGVNALTGNTVGLHNAAVGVKTLNANTSGNYNTAIGNAALLSSTTGDNNVAVGYQALQFNTTGNNNIAIGFNQDEASPTASNQLNIGGVIFGTDLTGTQLSPAGNVGIGTVSPAAKLDVAGKIHAIDEIFINRSTTEGGQLILQGQTSGTDLDWTIDQINTFSTSRFRIFPGTDESKGLTITQSGKVGVNMAKPNAKLDIRTNPTNAGDPGEGMFGLGSTTTAANAAGAGAMRYDTSSGGILQYSNGTDWNTLSSTVQKSIVVAKKTSPQTFSNAVPTNVTDWVEINDNNNNFDPTSGEFTAPRKGVYVVSFSFSFLASDIAVNARVEAQLTTGDTSKDKKSVVGITGSGNSELGAAISFPVPLNQGEKIRPAIYQLTAYDKTFRVGTGGDDGFVNFSVAEL
jgi:hypothetical protein